MSVRLVHNPDNNSLQIYKFNEVDVAYEFNLTAGTITVNGELPTDKVITSAVYCTLNTVNCTTINCTTIQCTTIQCSGYCTANCYDCKDCQNSNGYDYLDKKNANCVLCYDCTQVA